MLIICRQEKQRGGNRSQSSNSYYLKSTSDIYAVKLFIYSCVQRIWIKEYFQLCFIVADWGNNKTKWKEIMLDNSISEVF